MTRYRKYSTKFFCPRCRQEKGAMQMLYLLPEENKLTCQFHPTYQKKCTCKISDMIIFDMYPEAEEMEKVIEEAPDFEEDKVEEEVFEEESFEEEELK